MLHLAIILNTSSLPLEPLRTVIRTPSMQPAVSKVEHAPPLNHPTKGCGAAVLLLQNSQRVLGGLFIRHRLALKYFHRLHAPYATWSRVFNESPPAIGAGG
jgi:hypothetical protein